MHPQPYGQLTCFYLDDCLSEEGIYFVEGMGGMLQAVLITFRGLEIGGGWLRCTQWYLQDGRKGSSVERE